MMAQRAVLHWANVECLHWANEMETIIQRWPNVSMLSGNMIED